MNSKLVRVQKYNNMAVNYYIRVLFNYKEASIVQIGTAKE